MVLPRRDDCAGQRGVRQAGREEWLQGALDSRGRRPRAVRACRVSARVIPSGCRSLPASRISGRATRSRWRRRRRRSRNFPAGAFCSASASVTSLSSATCAGTTYDKPYSYMKEYLPKMKGALYMAPPPKEPVPVVLAALHPKMLALSASEANGTHTYFVPPEHTAKARAQIGPNAMLCAAQAVILETDADQGSQSGARVYEDLCSAPAQLHQQSESARMGRQRIRKRMLAIGWSTRSWRGAMRRRFAIASTRI